MRTLRLGSVEQPDLQVLISKMKEFGFLRKDYDSTQFDAELSAAVKIFQSVGLDSRGMPLTVDGIVGPLTWKSINEDDQTYIFDALERKLSLPETEGVNPIALHALEVALEEMLAGAGEVGGNNQGPFVAKYHRVTPDILEVKQWNWCAAFVSFCFRNGAAKIGKDMPFKYSGGAQNILKQFQSKGWGYKPNEQEPKPGDIVVWKRGSAEWMGHIGIVYEYKDGILYTIEGNRGKYPSRVAKFSYVFSNMKSLLGFGRIPEDF